MRAAFRPEFLHGDPAQARRGTGWPGKFSYAIGGAESDGLGWWLGYIGAALRATNEPLRYVMDELPLIQGFALIADARLNNPWAALDIDGEGYIAQERFKQANAP